MVINLLPDYSYCLVADPVSPIPYLVFVERVDLISAEHGTGARTQLRRGLRNDAS